MSPVVDSPVPSQAGVQAGSVVRRRHGRRRSATARRAMALRWGTIAGLVVVWQIVCMVWAQDSSFFATPIEVAKDGIPYLFEPSTLDQIATTAQRFAAAFAITAVAGVTIGLLLGRAGRLYEPARNVLYVLYTLPQVPFYPLFVLWLGLGFWSEVAFGVTHGLIPVIFGTMAAVVRVDAGLVDAARALGAGPLKRARMVTLPSIVPGVVASLRLGASLCLVGVLIAEILVSVEGIGGQINQLAGTLQAARLDAVILAICVAAVVVNSAVGLVERRLSRWRT